MQKIRNIIKIWPTPEDMEKDLEVDIDNQTIKNLKTGRYLRPFITGKRSKNNIYYAIRIHRNNRGYNIKIHLIFFYAKHRYIPHQVDHIDKNKANNSIDNLRPCTPNLNNFNKYKSDFINGKKPTSRHKGVGFNKANNKWLARVRVNKKLTYLGCYDEEDVAGEVVNQFYINNNLKDFAVFNDTPEQRERMKQFIPLSKDMQHLKSLFSNSNLVENIK